MERPAQVVVDGQRRTFCRRESPPVLVVAGGGERRFRRCHQQLPVPRQQSALRVDGCCARLLVQLPPHQRSAPAEVLRQVVLHQTVGREICESVVVGRNVREEGHRQQGWGAGDQNGQPVGIVVKPVIRIWYDLWLVHRNK